MTAKLLSPLLLLPFLVFSGCSHYAPGYDGWTRAQVAQMTQDARERHHRYPRNDAVLLGVDYGHFNKQGYRPALLGLARFCPSLPYIKVRQVDTVRIETAVCLDSQGRVLRVLQELSSPDEHSLEQVVALVNDEIRDHYGAKVVAGLDNRFLSSAEYRQIYVTGTPTREQLLHYRDTRISDHIASIRPDWLTTRQDPAFGKKQFYLDIRFQGYERLIRETEAQRNQHLKDSLETAD